MEKLSKTSKIVDKVLKVCYWLLLVSAAIVVFVYGLIVFVPSFADAQDNSWSLNLGNVELVLADDVMSGKFHAGAEPVYAIVSMVVLAGFTCYGIKLLRNILAPMIKEQPFAGTVSTDLKKLGWVLICGSIAFGIVECVGTAIVYSVYDVSNILISDKVTAVNLNLAVVDVKTILIGVLVFMLSHVFKYGEKLQQQDDETL